MEQQLLAKNWKDHLLRSGVPLEYQVARMVAEHGMSVDADFAFVRRDISGEKEWSVDIAATEFVDNRKGNVLYQNSLLIECKYRSPEKIMLFIGDPNIEYSPITLGRTIQAIDFHTPHHISTSAFEAMDREITFAYKGIEIHETGAVEQDIRHAIQQLRYAIPLNIKRRIDFGINAHPSDVIPMFFANILVTNAQIRVMADGIDLKAIGRANSIEEISNAASYVGLYSDYGPDYETHFRSVFADQHEERVQSARHVGDRLALSGKELGSFDSPTRYVEDLRSADRYLCSIFSTQFFVTSLDGLPELLKKIKSACAVAYRTKTKTNKILRSMRRHMA